MEQVVIEYVPEKAELEDGMDEFRNVFEKFNFLQSAGSEVKGLVFLFYPILF
jgi:splicing factor 3B subunit 2